jgi:hypothetical protein
MAAAAPAPQNATTGLLHIGAHAMTLPVAHYLHRAEEARVAARLCGDPTLRGLLLDIACGYLALADDQYLATHAAPPGVAVDPAAPGERVARPRG